ncbi:MAG: cell division protein FtsA, partial [Proteobacteria bacterium]|nr:cell division protein FtsA [Pseudomonadota bacterium]
IGGGTTDVAIWVKGALVHNYVLALGGNHLTNDIAQSLQTSVIDAERLKIQSGCAMTSAVGTDEIVLIPMPGGREPKKRPKQVIAEIIQPRLEEIFEIVAKEIEKSGHKDEIPAGIVLTGGTAQMDAVPELAESIFGMPVRRGIPSGIGGMIDFVQNPKCATAIGLLLHAMNQHDIASYSPQDEKNSSLLGRFVSWLKQIV